LTFTTTKKESEGWHFDLSRSAIALVDRNKCAATESHITDSVSGTTSLKGRPSTNLVRSKITASAASPQRSIERGVTTNRRFVASGALLAKSMVYLSLYGLVSAIALIYKYVLFALTFVVARLYPAKFDRDAVMDALNQIEMDSRPND
jgi:hypothetical protein